MSLPEFSFEAWAGKLAGVAGAFVSMNFLQGTWWEKLMMAISGALSSFYLTPWVSEKTGLPEGGAGFFLGLFAMAFVSRVWEWLRGWDAGELWEILKDWLRRLTGTDKPKDNDHE